MNLDGQEVFMPRFDLNPDQPFRRPVGGGGPVHGGGTVVVTAASQATPDLILPDVERPFEERVHEAYRPENLQSIEGPRLYQSNNTSTMSVQQAYEAAMGLDMVRLRQAVGKALPPELVDGVQIPIDMGIRAVGTYRDIEAEDSPRTAEPSLVLGFGPGWDGRTEEVLALAARLAADLSQQTVAAFIPRPDMKGDAYHFQYNLAPGRRPTPAELDFHVSSIQEAYTFHLDEEGRVKALDVIGSFINAVELEEQVRRYDPDPLVSVQTGDAYLVSASGERISI
jgi:hypothetical protein